MNRVSYDIYIKEGPTFTPEMIKELESISGETVEEMGYASIYIYETSWDGISGLAEWSKSYPDRLFEVREAGEENLIYFIKNGRFFYSKNGIYREELLSQPSETKLFEWSTSVFYKLKEISPVPMKDERFIVVDADLNIRVDRYDKGWWEKNKIRYWKYI